MFRFRRRWGLSRSMGSGRGWGGEVAVPFRSLWDILAIVRNIRCCREKLNKPDIIDSIEIHVFNNEELIFREGARRIVFFRDYDLYCFMIGLYQMDGPSGNWTRTTIAMNYLWIWWNCPQVVSNPKTRCQSGFKTWNEIVNLRELELPIAMRYDKHELKLYWEMNQDLPEWRLIFSTWCCRDIPAIDQARKSRTGR